MTSHGSSTPSKKASDSEKKEPRVKPEHVVPIIVALITTLGGVTASLVAVLVTRDDTSSAAVPSETQTVYVTTDPAGGGGTSTSAGGDETSSAAAPTRSATPPKQGVIPLTSTPWRDYNDDETRDRTRIELVQLGDKPQSESFIMNTSDYCSEYALVIPRPSSAGDRLTGTLGIPPEEDKSTADTEIELLQTTDRLVGPEKPKWSEIGRYTVLKSSPESVNLPLDRKTTGIKFRVAISACDRTFAFGDGKFS